MATVAIDHVIVATSDLKEATEPWRRLGLAPALGTRHVEQGTENAALFLGDSPETMFYIEFLTISDGRAAATSARGRKLAEAIDSGQGLFRVVLESDDLTDMCLTLERDQTVFRLDEIDREDGSRICDVVTLAEGDETSLEPRLIQYALSRQERFDSRRARGAFASTFDLTRLDHLAALPPDIEGATKTWTDTYGLDWFGTVSGNGLRIHQMKAGDAVVELLAPDGPDSRLVGAKPGLRSMVACEVDDLEMTVVKARERGFTLPEPTDGVLPDTRTSTISPDQLSGVALQLLEYE